MEKSKLYPEKNMTKHEAAFWKFHERFPRVTERLFEILNQAFERGFSSYGIAAAVEIVRWQDGPLDDRKKRFQINNNHRAFYSRLYQNTFPQHASKIIIREQLSVS